MKSDPHHIQFGYDGDYLYPLLCSDQRTLAEPGHGLYLSVRLAGVQKLKCMMQLRLTEFSRSALPKVGIMSGHCFSCLSALHDHASLILGEGQHDRQNQIPGERVLDQAHIQDMHPNTPVKKLPDRRNTVYGRPCEPIQLGDNQSITRL